MICLFYFNFSQTVFIPSQSTIRITLQKTAQIIQTKILLRKLEVEMSLHFTKETF